MASQEQFLETYAKLDTLTHGSKKMLVWKCPKGHESWVARISTRSRGSGCPCCSGHRTGPDNSLSVLRPGLASEWDREKNGGLTPYDVTVSSSKKVWWVCEGGHSWLAAIHNRSRGTSCPFCSGKKASPDNSLHALRPDLASGWDKERNGGLTPHDITTGSTKKAWWICDKGHSWFAQISSRSKGRGCPFCSGRRIGPDNDLHSRRPDLALEWDQEKNGGLTPHDVMPGSDKKAWWTCDKGHSWFAYISSRSSGCGCPKCALSANKIEKRIIDTFSEQTDLIFTAHGARLNSLSYSSGRTGVEVDIILYHNNHYLLVEYDGSYWHRAKSELDTEKSRLLLSLGDNILHARIRENELPELDLVHDRFAQFRHDYHATESDSIERTVKEIERWFMEKIGE